MIELLDSPGAASRGFAAGAIANGYLFASLNASDADPKLRAGSVAEETRFCIEKLSELMAKKGLSLRQVVKVNCYLASDSYRKEFWDEYNRLFSPGPYPTRCTYGVGLGGNCRVQLDVVAKA